MTSMSATIQEAVFDYEVLPVIPANEECEDHFDTESLPKQPVISHWNSRTSTVKLRTGKNCLNPKIMNVVVHYQAKYKLSENDTIGFWVYFANMTLD